MTFNSKNGNFNKKIGDKVKCPSCGNEVPENNNYCNRCGASLYGPRSINLNDISKGGKVVQSNNIQSITGIDINELTTNSTSQNNDKPESESKEKLSKKIKDKKSNINISFGTIILVAVIIGLMAVSIMLYLQNQKLKKAGGNPNLMCEEQVECIEGIYGITSNYSFLMPNDWLYTQANNETILTNQNISLLIFPGREGKLENLPLDTIKNAYSNQAIPVVETKEESLHSKKIYYISYTLNEMNFVDFYYQYNSETIVHGQVSSKDSMVITDDVQDIISSIVIRLSETNITIGKADINYENIFSNLN